MSWTKEKAAQSNLTLSRYPDPESIMVMRNIINPEPFDFGIHRLSVGTREETGVLFIAKYRWKGSEKIPSIVERYDFQDDKLVGMSPAAEKGDFFDRPTGSLIEDGLLFYFQDLGKTRPELAGSLGRCMGTLLIPDPNIRLLITE